MNWNEQPYKAALSFTGGDREVALEVIELAEFINEIGLTEYPEVEIIERRYSAY